MWLLAQHPEVIVSFHAGFFHSLASIEKWRHTPGSFGKFIVPALSADPGKTPNNNGRQIKWQSAIPPDLFQNQLRNMACEFFDTLAGYGNNPKVVVENTPENIKFLSWILDILPEIRILHIIRDPRSIWLSVRNSNRSWVTPNDNNTFPTTLLECAGDWCKYMDLSREIQEKTSHYTELKYEALKDDGIHELERIFDWLQLPVNSKFCKQALENTTLDKLKQKMPSPAGFFNQGKKERWKKELAYSEIRQIEYMAGHWMDNLQYERQLPAQEHKPWQLWMGEQKDRVARFIKRKVNHW